ncbi:MAG: preprotein translocase subunit SecE [Burkholderiaceae bacterium]|jgi:preprotein translocase subunit SecE|nr:preprotein translocase subunit SecE [Burkholderiales bacterium]NCV85636.1 preprotein translocase subunit SecE [Oxalobacteraceae bacterium]NCW85175.1 preprotein translocase subunit SecE [Oxalobacteraceae bacterium]NDG06579.1 preprotein translocase subunit SecE [Oxalobacteraceae bacterium]
MSNQSVQTVTTSADKAKLALAALALAAGVIGFYALAGQSGIIRAAALVGGLLLAVVFASTSQMGRDFIDFARESVRETKKVVWPSRKEATQITGVVFGFVVVMAIFLWGTDKLLEFVLYSLILGWR